MAVSSRDAINLNRIVKRLENPETPATSITQAENVKYARVLAKRVYGSETNPYEQRLNAVEHRLDASSIASSYRRKAPSVRSYTSMIEPLEIPAAAPELKAPEETPASSPTAGDEDPTSLVSQMLLPSEEVVPPAPPTLSTNLLPLPSSSSQSSSAKASSITPEFLTTSRQTQEEIAQRLADMATQLRRNAQHFATALEDDKDALAEVDTNLDTNLTFMQKTRGRLGTYSSKSRGTTWLVFLSILVVFVAWVVMFFVIRLT